jgi:hypothetical protein
LPEAINNDGITIIISGIAQTVGEAAAIEGRKRTLTSTHNPQRIDRIQALWKALFTKPERINFEPYCRLN